MIQFMLIAAAIWHSYKASCARLG